MLFALPDNSIYRFPSDYPYPREVYAPVWEGSGRNVPCVVVGPSDAERRIMLFHGNGETIQGARSMALDIARCELFTFTSSYLFRRAFWLISGSLVFRAMTRRCRARVFIIDYPGYWVDDNGSPPKPRTARGVYEAASSAAKLMRKECSAFHVVGYSLGTALAVRVARENADIVESMSLIAPICSALSAAASSPNESLRGLKAIISIVKPLISPLDVFCAEKDAPFVATRSSVVYGDADTVVSASQGIRMAKLLRASIMMVEGEDHTTIRGSGKALAFVTRNVCDGGGPI